MRLFRPYLLLVTPLVVACSDPTSALWPIDASLTVDRESLEPGEQALVTVTVTNRSDDPVTIDAGVCDGAFEVRTLLGIVVGPPQVPCLAVLTLEELAPGESHVFQRAWDGSGVTEDRSARIELPPDEYFLRARVRIWGGPMVRGEDVRIRLEE